MRFRHAPLACVVLLSFGLVISCSSGSGRASARSSTPSTGPTVVDGITVPPLYVTPAGTVVPGPSSCPADFGETLHAAAPGLDYRLTSQVGPHLVRCMYQGVPAGVSGSGECRDATVIVNTEPQAFTDFNRWSVETGQVSMWTSDPNLRPTPIQGIGTLAEWVPALLELGTGNDTTWVSVTLTCPADTATVLALAERLAMQGLASSA